MKLPTRPISVRVQMPPVQQLKLFYFKVTLQGDEITVEQFPDFPPEANDENGSLLSFSQFGVGLHVTWLPAKPEPTSDIRPKAYMKIIDDIANRMPPDEAKAFRAYPWGFGHAKGATVQWHTQTND